MLALTLLTIPPAAATHAMQDTSSSGADTYTVQPGDTLNSIARRAGVGVDELARLNGLADPDTIFVGMVLRLPEGAAQPQPATTVSGPLSQPSPVPAGMAAPTPGPAVPSAGASAPRSTAAYTVQPGDTLYSIALRFGTTPLTLVDLNGPGVANQIYVGQPLIVPGAPVTSMSSGGGPASVTTGAPQTMGAQPPGSVLSAGPLASASATRGDSIALHTTGAPVAPGMAPRPSDASPATAFGTAASLSPRDARMAVPAGLPSANLPGAGPAALSAVRIALQYIGAPYVYGGDGPSGFDCSGFVQFVMRQAGRTVPRDLLGQYTAGPHPPGPGSLEPGDLVFFQDTYDSGLSHVGIYVGNGNFIHAVSEATGVGISSLSEPYYVDHWYGATRLQ